MAVNVEINVEGMSCGHCKGAIENGLGGLDGVNSVSVDLAGKKVAVSYEEGKIDMAAIKQAIEEEGFDVIE